MNLFSLKMVEYGNKYGKQLLHKGICARKHGCNVDGTHVARPR